MTGTIRWNLYGGAVAFVLTFIASITRNIFVTTLLNSFYSFVLVFAIIFLFRFVLHLILNGPGTSVYAESPEAAEAAEDAGTGSNINLATPDDHSLNDLLKPKASHSDGFGDDAGFAPLKPPKLVSQAPELNPEELANALRRMSEE
ncbi:hypothetical protein ACFFK0_18175 [Paenibacillus chartarius]|uniref:Uncharacterized protein n=1 Tax=Paenibacillus chartarius TaxID=747481 RepID=A0ABV6DP30_9BACL